MFRQIKEMFRKEEVLPLALAQGEIPGWLTEEYSLVGAKEKIQIELSRKKILGYIENLRELVGSLGSTEHEGDVHPKLGNVVEKSLPLYKKTILSAMNRQYPESPDEFYVAATECLKGCLKSSAGPGRYLTGVFPGEMKEIRAVIDHVGREINAMNPVIAESRKKREELTRIRELYDSYLKSCEELLRAEKQYPELTSRLSAMQGEIGVINDELSRLSHDPRMKQLDEFHAEAKELEEEQERALAEFSSSADMVVHVLKRAEKVAQKDHNLAIAKKVHILAELLVKSEIPGIVILCQELDDILPDIIGMVNNGNISLRNKEEHYYFSNPAVLPGKMQEIFSRVESAGNQLKETRKKIDGNSFIHEKESLDRCQHTKMNEYAELEKEKDSLDGRITTLKDVIPSLLRQIEDNISSYSGKKAIIRQETGNPR
jgi:predicted  nucleic acid-binding Zn-ribbon protein